MRLLKKDNRNIPILVPKCSYFKNNSESVLHLISHGFTILGIILVQTYLPLANIIVLISINKYQGLTSDIYNQQSRNYVFYKIHITVSIVVIMATLYLHIALLIVNNAYALYMLSF